MADTRGGFTTVYESSAAGGPHIWLNVASGDCYGGTEGTAHLTLDQARQVPDQLNWLADNHYQETHE